MSNVDAATSIDCLCRARLPFQHALVPPVARRAVLRIAGPAGELAPHTAMRYDMQDRHPQPWAYPGPYGRRRLHAWGYRLGLHRACQEDMSTTRRRER